MREGSGGDVTVNHGWDMPEGVQDSSIRLLGEDSGADFEEGAPSGVEAQGPFVSKKHQIKDCKIPAIRRHDQG